MKLSACVLLLCCWAHQGLAQGLSDAASQVDAIERKTFGQLLLNPEENFVKLCATGALSLSKGMTAFAMAGTDIEEVADSLRVRTAGNPARGERLLSIWKSRRGAAPVAAADFEECLGLANIRLPAADTEYCFIVSAVFSTAEFHRQPGKISEDRALTLAEKTFGKIVPLQLIKYLTKQAYSADLEKDSAQILRESLANCLIWTK